MKEYLSSYLRRTFAAKSISRAEEEAEAHEIQEIAREFFSTDFPNPQRVGCPPKESFGNLIGGKHLPGKELQNHLLSCSECFNEYRAELSRANSATVSKKNIYPLGIRLALAGGLVAVLIVIGGLFWFRQNTSNSPEIAQNKNISSTDAGALSDAGTGNTEPNVIASVENPPPLVESNNTNAASQINSPGENKNKQKSPVKESDSPLSAKNDIEIDFDYPIWRDSPAEDASNQKILRLEARKTRIRVRLPKENPEGIYQVFIVDEFAKALTKKQTIRSKNQSLSVELDLRKITGNQKRLCFAPVGEIPDCVLVNVVPPKK